MSNGVHRLFARQAFVLQHSLDLLLKDLRSPLSFIFRELQ